MSEFRWAMSLLSFSFYYVVFFMAFMNRPFSMTTNVITGDAIGSDGQLRVFQDNDTLVNDGRLANASFVDRLSDAWFDTGRCHLWKYGDYGFQGYTRMVCEPIVLLMVFFQMISEAWDIRHIGRRRWWRVLKSFPSKILYKTSFLLILLIVPVRLLCGLGNTMLLLDNMLSLICVLITTTHFLYYCRAIKFVGPFVLMVYTIITRDMLRFFLIYSIFLIGFSQGFYIIFRSCERERLANPPNSDDILDNIIANPMESVLRLFIMTAGEFTVFYRELSVCQLDYMAAIGKILFMIFEISVSLMQFNLLIAMMTRTYELIYESQKEWKRQWAQVILMLELSINPKSRLRALLEYSRPIGTDKRKRAFVVSRKIESDTDIERLRREQQAHAIREEKKMILKRRLKDALNKDGRKSGLRPMTAFFGPSTPLPPRM